MNTKTTLIFAVILLICTVTFLLTDKHERKTKEVEDAKKELFSLNVENVNGFSFLQEDRTAVFEKQNERWLLLSPESHLASAATVERFLTMMSESSKEEDVDENPADLAQYGLEPPLVTFSIQSGDMQQQLFLGKKNYSGISYYAKKKDSPAVFTVSSIVGDEISRDWSAFLETGAFHIDSDGVTEILVKNGDKTFEMKASGENWIITSPTKASADKVNVQNFIYSLQRLGASNIVEKTGVDLVPALSITLKQKKAPQDTLILSAKLGDIYKGMRLSTGEVFDIPGVNGDALFVTLGDFIDKHIVRFDVSELKKIEITSGEKQIVLERKDKEPWKIKKPKSSLKEAPSVDALLWKLEDLKYTGKITGYKVSGPLICVKLFAGEQEKALNFEKSESGCNISVKDDAYEADGEIFQLLETVVNDITAESSKK